MDPLTAPSAVSPEGYAPDAGAGKPYDDRLARFLLIPLATILAAVLITFFVQYSAHEVVGPSMEPTLLGGDRLLVTRGYDSALRGDVVVFKAGEGAEDEDFVKRVVAVPGDTVSTANGIATVNGVTETGEGLTLGGWAEQTAPVTVAPGTVFVMGDNRAVSLDSRYIGPVPLERIRGRAVYVFAPVDRVRKLAPKPGP